MTNKILKNLTPYRFGACCQTQAQTQTQSLPGQARLAWRPGPAHDRIGQEMSNVQMRTNVQSRMGSLASGWRFVGFRNRPAPRWWPQLQKVQREGPRDGDTSRWWPVEEFRAACDASKETPGSRRPKARYATKHAFGFSGSSPCLRSVWIHFIYHSSSLTFVCLFVCLVWPEGATARTDLDL